MEKPIQPLSGQPPTATLVDRWIVFLPGAQGGESRVPGRLRQLAHDEQCLLIETGCVAVFPGLAESRGAIQTFVQALPGTLRSQLADEFSTQSVERESVEKWASIRLRLYNVLAFDNDELEVFSDPLGILRYFRAYVDGGLVLSSSIRLLFSCLPDLTRPVDPVALLELLGGSSPRFDRTLHARVHRSRPGDVIRWSHSEGPSTTRPRRLVAREVDSSAESAESLDRIHGRITEQIEPSIADPSSLLLPLTGGFDSRLLACLISEAGLDFKAITLGLPHHNEVRTAREVARVLRLDHRVEAPRKPSRAHIGHWKSAIECQGGTGTLFICELLDQGFRQGTTVFHGLLNDLLIGGGWLTFGSADLSDHAAVVKVLAKKLYPNPPEGLTKILGLSYDFDATVKEVSEEVPEAPEPYQSMQLWVLENWDTRLANMVHLLGSEYHVAVPYYDVEYIQDWISVPYHLKENRRLFRQLLARYHPSVADIPHSDLPPRLAQKGWFAHKYLAQWHLHRLVFRAKRRLFPGGLKLQDPRIIWGFWKDQTRELEELELARILENKDFVGEVLGLDLPISAKSLPWNQLEPSERAHKDAVRRSFYLLTEYCKWLREGL